MSENGVNQLPPSIQGDGRKFISLLKNYLKEIADEVNAGLAKFENIYNTLADNPDTIKGQIKSVTVEERSINGNVSLILKWDSSDIKQYNGASIDVKVGNFTDNISNFDDKKVVRHYDTTKTNTFTIDNVEAGKKYWIKVRGKDIRNALSEEHKAPVALYYVSEETYAPRPPYEATIVFDKHGAYWSWKQYPQNEYQWTELRLDEHVGDVHNRLDLTTDWHSNAKPHARIGKGYLYNKGVGNAYSAPATIEYSKPVPAKPTHLIVKPIFEGLYITFANIPEDCTGAKIYINNEEHFVVDNKFSFNCSTGTYTIKVCYVDVFGDGEISDPVIIGTVEEIPPDAVHITDRTVFDNGVIVAKYIGDKAIVGTKIADDTITTGKLVANAITGDKIAANAVTTDKIKAGSVTATQIATDAVTADKIKTGSVTSDKVVAGAITGDKIAGNSISGDKIQAGAIDANKIKAGAVDATKMNVDKLSSITANVGNLTGGTITGGTIVGSTIRNEAGSFLVSSNGDIRGANITGSRIDASSIYSEGQQLKNTHFINKHVRSGERIELPKGYSYDRCLIYITNHKMKPEKVYEQGGRYFSDENIDRIHNFNNKYSTYWNERPSSNKMKDLESGHWLHGEPLNGRVFFLENPAPFPQPFIIERIQDQMQTFKGCGVTREGYFFYFINDGDYGKYGEADVLIIAFW